MYLGILVTNTVLSEDFLRTRSVNSRRALCGCAGRRCRRRGSSPGSCSPTYLRVLYGNVSVAKLN